MSRILTLNDYQSFIDLQPKSCSKFIQNKIDYNAVVQQIVQYFTGPTNPYSRHSIQQQRAFIREILTVRDPAVKYRYPVEIYDLIDQMLVYERDYLTTLTKSIELPVQFPSLPYIRVWRGDITTLVIDAIVNAGNSALLGCFQPTHLCIDNVIHAASGPRLRDDCYTIMNKQCQSESVGHAKVTAGYNLPSKYVLHTVGPQLFRDAHVTRQNVQELASCYETCLNLAADMKTIASIGFCCISTGLFAFPADTACRIAIQTVTDWFQQRGSNTRISLIVFNVFTVEDEQRYLSALTSLSRSR